MTNGFKFIRVDSFLDDINREDCFDTQDMDGLTPNFKLLLVSNCPQDINECLDEFGTLRDDNVSIIETDGIDDGLCSLKWSTGVNGERLMSISDATVSYDLGESNKTIKGIFLVSVGNGSGYVIAYSIFDEPIIMDGTLILAMDGMIWSIRYGN